MRVIRVRSELWTAQDRETAVADVAAGFGSAGGDEGTTQLDLLGDADAALATVCSPTTS